MANPSPLITHHDAGDVEMMAFGRDIAIVAIHDMVETEYGRLRNRAAMMDCPHRALIELAGGDRHDFLHRMLTNDCAPGSTRTQPGSVTRQLLLDRQGRITADLVQLEAADRTYLDTDLPGAAGLLEELDKMLFGEDVRIGDATDRMHRLSFHGPKAADVAATLDREGAVTYRHDQCDVPGVHVWMPVEQVEGAWQRLADTGDPEQTDVSTSLAKPIGWLAFNMARIEAGTPLYHVDFGTDTIPNQTPLLAEAVSNTKGCYRGQEIVARIRDRGHPSKLLVRFEAAGDELPAAGESVFAGRDLGQPVGAVTSSAPSPLKSGKPIGIAMVKWGCHEPGTTLHAPAETGIVAITVDELASA